MKHKLCKTKDSVNRSKKGMIQKGKNIVQPITFKEKRHGMG